MVLGSASTCPTASLASSVGNSSGVTLGSSTLDSSFSVSITAVTSGAYIVCVQPGGSGDFVQVPGFLTVKGAAGFSPALVMATAATSGGTTSSATAPVLTITGFGLSSGDSVRVIGSNGSCSSSSANATGAVLGAISVSNVSSAGASVATVALVVLPPGTYIVCLQQVGQMSASTVPGNLLTARGE